MPRPRRRARTPTPKSKPDDIKALLGRRVRELREKAGMTQKDLAHASGISGVFLGTVERGEKAATVETVEKLARGLAVPPADLFRFEAPTKEAGGFERLTRKLAGLARGASERKLERFERIARAFFEED